MDPKSNIVPIFGIKRGEGHLHFAGSSFFCTSRYWLITADHVVSEFDDFEITTPGEEVEEAIWHPTHLVKRFPERDLAILRVPSYQPPEPIQFANKPPVCDQVVLNFEYSTTEKTEKVDYLNPATRLGNIVRSVDLTQLYGVAGEKILELSFPALKGASGSPVLFQDGFALAGVVKGNVNHHLLPVHIEEILDGDDYIERTQYLLPQGLAVHEKHVRDCVNELSAE